MRHLEIIPYTQEQNRIAIRRNMTSWNNEVHDGLCGFAFESFGRTVKIAS